MTRTVSGGLLESLELPVEVPQLLQQSAGNDAVAAPVADASSRGASRGPVGSEKEEKRKVRKAEKAERKQAKVLAAGGFSSFPVSAPDFGSLEGFAQTALAPGIGEPGCGASPFPAAPPVDTPSFGQRTWAPPPPAQAPGPQHSACPGPPYEFGPMHPFPPDSSAGDAGHCAQLEAQVQILQANNTELQAQLADAHEQLGAALQRFQQPQGPQLAPDLADARASLADLREAHAQLHAELDQSRHELKLSRQQLGNAEAKLAEREALLSQARQRLFDEKRRSGQLEDEIQSREAMQTSLQGRLQSERSKQTALERDLCRLQHAFGTTTVLRSSEGVRATSAPRAGGGGNVRYGAASTGAPARGDSAASVPAQRASVPPQVQKHDELAGTVSLTETRTGKAWAADSPHGGPKAPFDPGGAILPDYEAVAPRVLRGATPETWMRTPRVSSDPAVIVSRTPPASYECAERTRANFRNLLMRRSGPLYEDGYVVVEFAMGACSGSRPSELRCSFEAIVLNCSRQPIQQLRLEAVDAGQFAPLRMQVDRKHPGDVTAASWPQERCLFQGRVEVFAAYEKGPLAELSYLLPDNLCCRARFRLPIVVTNFMKPAQPSAPQWLNLWHKAKYVESEVAFVCVVRGAFLDAGGHFFFSKCLELGGLLYSVSGVAESPQSLTLASSYPTHDAHAEVLVHAEFGSPRGEKGACRIAVRSGCYLVNRGLAQVLLDALCGGGAAAGGG